MKMVVDWTLSSVDICVSQVAMTTGTSEARVRQMYRTGALGSAPDVNTHVRRVSLNSIAALFVWLDAEKLNLAPSRIADVLPCIAGAAYIRLALTELSAGRCTVGRGTPSLTTQLWAKLRSDEGPRMLETKLPGGPVQTRRYAVFDEFETQTCDDLNEIGNLAEHHRIIDAWSIATRMKQGLRGTLFTTQIA